MKATLSLAGLDALLEKLAKSSADIDADIADALDAGADVALEGMRERVPVRTGMLQSKLTKRGPIHSGNYTYIDVGLIGADAEVSRYGNVIEFGAHKKPARSYIRLTMIEDGRKIRKRMADILRERAK
jgi:HK97 gp10 family phage protein